MMLLTVTSLAVSWRVGVAAAWADKWSVLGRHERAAEWLRVWADLGRAPRTIDAYARGLAEYLQVCERDGTDPLAASRVGGAVDRGQRHLIGSSGQHGARAAYWPLGRERLLTPARSGAQRIRGP